MKSHLYLLVFVQLINSFVFISYAQELFEDTFIFNVNNLKLPINNFGVIGNDALNSSQQTEFHQFENSSVLYSAGFTLAGYSNDTLWSNGIMTSNRITDYIPGPVSSNEDSIQFKLYKLNSLDTHFGDSWQEWKTAVKLGAKFYDGNHNGIYDPIDLNENGKWDENEDRPDLIGDLTVWCVYNDGKKIEDRTVLISSPLGIEVKQTIFAYSDETAPSLSNVIFVRYSFENTGLVSVNLDSVFFSAWSDIDIGDYSDDLVACDTTLSSAYVYNSNEDDNYGINPPALFVQILQGPIFYINGVSYLDQNNNNIYDEGMDIPLTNAQNNYGKYLGISNYPGALNNGMTSFIAGLESHPTLPDAIINNQHAYYYLTGRNIIGELLQPCIWDYGNVFNFNCENVNPIFMYSGDIINNKGWINNRATDQRTFLNTGPFQLVKDKPQEIIVAYIVRRGTDALNSITIAKEIAQNVIDFYKSNFIELPVGVKEPKSENIPTEFVIEQNYPNPFNPTTTIKYSIASKVKSEKSKWVHPEQLARLWRGVEGFIVRLTIFDILGREVATLVNQKQKPGNYEINFDASKYSSGVYYYQLKVGASTSSATSFMKTKKMILLK